MRTSVISSRSLISCSSTPAASHRTGTCSSAPLSAGVGADVTGARPPVPPGGDVATRSRDHAEVEVGVSVGAVGAGAEVAGSQDDATEGVVVAALRPEDRGEATTGRGRAAPVLPGDLGDVTGRV